LAVSIPATDALEDAIREAEAVTVVVKVGLPVVTTTV
jgi:hypothetical protein